MSDDIEQMRLDYSQDQQVWDLLDEIELLRSVVLHLARHELTVVCDDDGVASIVACDPMPDYVLDPGTEPTADQIAAVRRALEDE